jgi:hypothetical protein
MARTTDPQSDSRHTADGGQQRSPRNLRAPAAAAVVLTPTGQRRLASEGSLAGHRTDSQVRPLLPRRP